jgi:hypothetical protein
MIGHGIEANGTFYCCASCAQASGVDGVADSAPSTTAMSREQTREERSVDTLGGHIY